MIGDFLDAHDWLRDWGFNNNFNARAPIPGDHEMIWQDNCPIYANDVVAMCGGWHMPWPEGDWNNLQNTALVVWTFQKAEPWIEVLRHNDQFEVRQRAT